MKADRHTAIRTLLGKGPVPSQDELRRKLAARGFHVTQATLSRDIHDLKLSKGPGGYALPAAPAEDEDEGPAIEDMLSNFGLEVRQAQNLIVVISTTGGAQPIAAGIDYEEWPEVIGTIAGDDTVLIICQDIRRADALRRRIEVHVG
jgi:transcriptional regulator of arginine metabolism